jgi:purine nucleoside permease
VRQGYLVARLARAASALVLVITTMFGIPALSSHANGNGSVVGLRRLVVRVLVLTMLDDEAAPWLAKESLPILVPVPGAYAALRCARSGLCVATIGVGKSNAAASVMAILHGSQLDLHRSYFLTAGIAGTPPSVGTLGFAAWAHWLIDWDLGHHLLPSVPQVPHGYLPDNHYPGQAGKRPYVAACDTVTGDDYWAGHELSQTAQYVTALRTDGQARYCTTQQEDNATATALARNGYLDHYLSLRTASDFDEPSPGQSVTDSLAVTAGYQLAIENEYLVGSTVAHYLLTCH